MLPFKGFVRYCFQKVTGLKAVINVNANYLDAHKKLARATAGMRFPKSSGKRFTEE